MTIADANLCVDTAAQKNLPCNSSASPPRSSSTWSFLSAAVLGLLTSSCCVIQLALNAFSIGCAGFSVLTAFRPVFGTISLLLITYTIVTYRISARTALTLAIVLLLSASPEMVAIYNQAPSGALQFDATGSVSAWPLQPLVELYHKSIVAPHRLPQGSLLREDTAARALVSKDRSSPFTKSFIKYDIQVDGMACEACANRLRQHVMARPGIEHARVVFAERRLEIWARSGPGALLLSDHDVQNMVADVDSKYSAKLLGTYSDHSVDQ